MKFMNKVKLIDLTKPAEAETTKAEVEKAPQIAVGYKGEVTIKRVDTHSKKTKIYRIHNHGEAGLFSFLIHALQGENMKQYRPRYLMLYGDEDKALLTQRATVAFTPTAYKTQDNKNVVSYDTCDSVVFSFIVPSTQFKEFDMTVTKAALFSDRSSSNVLTNNDGLCAIAELNSGIQVSAGTNLMVYWRLKFEPIASDDVSV